MGDQGGVWYIPIPGGRFHCERVPIPGREKINGPQMCNCNQIHVIVTNGAFTVKHHRVIFVQPSIKSEGH